MKLALACTFLATPFIFIFVLMSIDHGVQFTSVVFGITAAITIPIFIGAWLLANWICDRK